MGKYLLVKKLEHLSVLMVTLDDGCLFHVCTQFRAEEFHNSNAWNSQGLCYIFEIKDVGLGTIKTRFLS